MNKHFEDTRYYLKRAGEHAKAGVKEEIEPLQEKVQGLMGEEPEPEPSRVEKLQQDLKELEEKAEGEARERIAEAREKVEEYRGSLPGQSA
jgi:peptidoglycan hydrolase CwlO-like protein